MIDPKLKGKGVLITGADSGIGAATARAFGAQGASVFLHYLGTPAEPVEPGVQIAHASPGGRAAEEVAGEVEELGGRAVLIEADLFNPGAAVRLFDAAEAEGPVHVLVNNAAHCELPDTITEATAGGLDRHLTVNARAPALLMHEFTVRYRRRGGQDGRIINVSADAARTFATQIGYGASKAALEALTRSVAVEVGPWGITANAVAPGPVQTGWMTDELLERILPSIPLRRVGIPEEIADAIVFLASHQARWISGQVIQVAGGHAL